MAQRPIHQASDPAGASKTAAAGAPLKAGDAVSPGQRPIPLEDLELIEQVRNGRSEAFGELVLKYQDRVFNACWRICGHREDARDVTQEAFIKAFEGLGEFRRESGFYTWLFRIAVNLSLSAKRKQQRRPTLSLDHQPGAQAEPLVQRVRAKREAGPVEAADAPDRAQLVVQALAALDDEQRATLVLRDIEGLDYQEIAVILDLPLGTMKSRLFRARMALRDALRQAAPNVTWEG